jgi:hypothetical protein
MKKIHDVHSVRVDETHLYVTVDGKAYRVRWTDCSRRLTDATPAQRERLDVSPSGYGIRWPEIDEDLAITPLLESAEPLPIQIAG